MGLRGDERIQDEMFSYVSMEQRVTQDCPLRGVRKLTDAVLRPLGPDFDTLYADLGLLSIGPGCIPRTLLLQFFAKKLESHDNPQRCRQFNKFLERGLLRIVRSPERVRFLALHSDGEFNKTTASILYIGWHSISILQVGQANL